MKCIEATNLQIGYRTFKKSALKVCTNLFFDASNGELIALIGSNGIGKSTLLRTISRLQPPLSGNLLINGFSFYEIKRIEYASILSFVSTEQIRIPDLSVYDLVALGRYPYTDWFGSLTLDDKSIIEESIRLVSMNSLQLKSVNELSDGERQRAMVARAIAQDTPIIVLDEPTAYLDVPNKFEIVKLLKDLSSKKNKTIIFSTHDLNIAISESDKIWLMSFNNIIEGAPEDLILSNSFDSLFEKKVQFDWETASFKQNKIFTRTVNLKGPVNNLYNLTKRALERIGIAINIKANLQVEIINEENNYSFSVVHSNFEKRCKNIYELCTYLNNPEIQNEFS